MGAGVGGWGQYLLRAETAGEIVGLSFASLALVAGLVFFVYSLKYYLTVAVVLSFSRRTARGGGEYAGEQAGRLGGFLSGFFQTDKAVGWEGDEEEVVPGRNWRSILGAVFGIRIEQVDEKTDQSAGLEPHLGEVELERYPFISVQIPFYNEKQVAERVIRACQAFDYPNFEVLILDDSTDETTVICERLAAEDERVKVLHRPTREGFKGGGVAVCPHSDESQS